MTRVSKAGSAAIVGDGKNGSSARIATAGLAMLISVLVGTARNSTARRDPGTALAIRVRVQDYAQLPQKMLQGAERVSASVLEHAGIQVTWINCPAPECQELYLPTDLGLRILPQSMADLVPANNDALGFALVSTDPGSCYLASVFYHRVKTLADALGSSRADILGYVMAHELGHLLLRSSGHSPFGIMQARWGAGQLELASANAMVFTPDQERVLRLGVKTRSRQ